jgi:hypothetical protein
MTQKVALFEPVCEYHLKKYQRDNPIEQLDHFSDRDVDHMDVLRSHHPLALPPIKSRIEQSRQSGRIAGAM